MCACLCDYGCPLYMSDAAVVLLSVDLGGLPPKGTETDFALIFQQLVTF